jgi:hypothetical protein
MYLVRLIGAPGGGILGIPLPEFNKNKNAEKKEIYQILIITIFNQ